MASIRSPLAEAVSRTITDLDRKYGTESPNLVDKIRRRVLVRLSDRLTLRQAAKEVVLVRTAPTAD